MKTGPAKKLYTTLHEYLKLYDTILNFGSGDGQLSVIIREGLHKDVIDIDVSDLSTTGVSPRIYDGHTIPLNDKSMDIAMSNFVLHHTTNHEELVDELKRVTRHTIIIAEDIMDTKMDRIAARLHAFISKLFGWGDQCLFRSTDQWHTLFKEKQLALASEKPFRGAPLYPGHRKIFILKVQ